MQLCYTLIFIILTVQVNIAYAELTPYNPKNKSTGIESYEYEEPNWINIKFKKSGIIYRYPKNKYGEAAILMMIDLAKNGDGLNQYLNTLPNNNYRRVQELPKQINCGVEGGYPKDEWWHFPVKTRGQARAALSYAHWAPNPDGIRRCVCRYFNFPSCAKIKLKPGESTPKGD